MMLVIALWLAAFLLGAIAHALLMRPRGMHAVPGGPLPGPEAARERYERLLAADPVDYSRPLDTPPDGIPAGGTGGFAPLCQTPDSPPWDIPTGSFFRVEEEGGEEAPPPTSADQDAEAQRAAYVRDHLPECAASLEVLERVRGRLRGGHPHAHANGWQ